MRLKIFIDCLPHQHIIFYHCEEFTKEIGWLGDQVSFCGDAISMLVAKSICQVKGAADMESIGDDTDSCAIRDKFCGEDQIFPGVGGLVFCQDPVGGKAVGFQDRKSVV